MIAINNNLKRILLSKNGGLREPKWVNSDYI